MTKTEKANWILLWIHKETKGDEFEELNCVRRNSVRNSNWNDGTKMDYQEFSNLFVKLSKKGLITMNYCWSKNCECYHFDNISLTKKGIEDCRKLVKKESHTNQEIDKTKVKNMTESQKENHILHRIYQGTDGNVNHPTGIRSFSESEIKDFNLGIEPLEVIQILLNMKDEGLISMIHNYKPNTTYLAEFKETRLTKKGKQKCELLIEAEKEKKGESKPQVKDDTIILYSWDSEPHKQKVLEFARELRKEQRIHATLDRWLNQEGTAIDFPKMMHLAITDYKKVIIVLSEGYKEKAEKFTGGVGNEFQLIIKDIEANPNKYVLVSFVGISNKIAPLALQGRHTIDMSNNDKTAWNELKSKLRDEPIIDKPPVAETQKPIEKQEIGKFNLDN